MGKPGISLFIISLYLIFNMYFLIEYVESFRFYRNEPRNKMDRSAFPHLFFFFLLLVC
ncbi:unnamed protein product, partial [Brassica oleracea]